MILRDCIVSHWNGKWYQNVEKCNVIHVGHGNKNFSYEMGGMLLESVDEERDVAVIVQKSVNVEKQSAKAVKSANSVLGMIRK